jgi:hypothetical protein
MRVLHVEMAGLLTFDTSTLCATAFTAYIIRLQNVILILTQNVIETYM